MHRTTQVTSLHQSLTETQKELREVGKKENNEFAVSATQAEVNSLQVNVINIQQFNYIVYESWHYIHNVLGRAEGFEGIYSRG